MGHDFHTADLENINSVILSAAKIRGILRKMHERSTDVFFRTNCISKRCIHMAVTDSDYNIGETGKSGMHVASTESNLNAA
jgi:hypothetical protein